MVGGVRLSWSVWGDDIIERELLRFSDRAVSNMYPAYLAVVHDMQQALTEQFETEGSRASGGWEPLSDAYAAWKGAQDFDPGTILRATNRMFDSLTDEDHPDNIMVIEGGNMAYGSSVEYGQFHQQGTSKMPMRKPLEFTELDKRGWMKQLQQYIVTGELGPMGVL